MLCLCKPNGLPLPCFASVNCKLSTRISYNTEAHKGCYLFCTLLCLSFSFFLFLSLSPSFSFLFSVKAVSELRIQFLQHQTPRTLIYHERSIYHWRSFSLLHRNFFTPLSNSKGCNCSPLLSSLECVCIFSQCYWLR